TLCRWRSIYLTGLGLCLPLQYLPALGAVQLFRLRSASLSTLAGSDFSQLQCTVCNRTVRYHAGQSGRTDVSDYSDVCRGDVSGADCIPLNCLAIYRTSTA